VYSRIERVASVALVGSQRDGKRLLRPGYVASAALMFLLLVTAVASGAFQLLSPAQAACSTASYTPLVVTDKADYYPGDTVRIDGCGFQNYVGQTLPVLITYPDSTVYTKTVVVDSSGNFTLYWVLTNAVVGKYLVQAYDASQTTVLASTTFTDSTVNLDQCSNGSPKFLDLHCDWQNGDLNGSNSEYAESQSVPYRLFITNLDPTVSHTIHFNYDFTRGGVEAIDFLTTWNVTQTGADPCSGSSAVPSPCPPGPATTFPMSGDPYAPSNRGGLTVNGAIAAAGGSRNLTIYNGTITSVSGVTHTGSDTSNSDADMLVTFTANACSGSGCKSKVELLWGGHLADSGYWGVGNGASSITGAPFHMRTQNLDGSGSMNQDRSMQIGAISTPTPTPTPTFTATFTPTKTSTPLSSRLRTTLTRPFSRTSCRPTSTSCARNPSAQPSTTAAG